MAVVDASHQPCCEPQQQMPQQIVEITEEEFYYGQGVSQRPSAPSSSFTGGTALFSYSAMVANLDFTQPTDLNIRMLHLKSPLVLYLSSSR